MALTSDDDGSSSFGVFTNTAVCATVLRLTLSDEEFQRGAPLLHLVSLSAGQHIVSLPPLHWDGRFGELAAECHLAALLHLDMFQFLKKFDGLFC